MKERSGLAEKIKIAFLMQESRMGGIEYNSVHLAGSMDRMRFEVVFLCPEEGKLPGLLREKKIPFLFYRRPPFVSTSIRLGKGYVANPFAVLYDFLCFFIIAFSLAGFLRRERFRIVFTKGILANFYGSLAAALSGVICVWDTQEIVPEKKALGLFRGMLNLWASVFPARIVVSSEEMKKQFSENIRPKVSVVPNGVDTSAYGPGLDGAAVRAEWGIRKDEILVGHAARFTYWKGQKDFLKAAKIVAAEIPAAKFALVGSPVFENDDYARELHALVKELGISSHVFFPGFRDDIGRVLAAMDTFVHSSIEAEGCPITLICAMSLGRPVVATAVSGNTEIVSSETQALLVQPEHPEEIAAAILKILKTPGLRDSLGRNARQRILERYSLEAYAKNCERIFEELHAA